MLRRFPKGFAAGRSRSVHLFGTTHVCTSIPACMCVLIHVEVLYMPVCVHVHPHVFTHTRIITQVHTLRYHESMLILF